MNRQSPLVSVIIPAYNRASTVQKAVESVLAQSYDHLEVLLIDDGSTDETAAVVQSIQDPRLRYIYQQNAGACAARNHGVSLAKGEYIAFHDHALRETTVYPWLRGNISPFTTATITGIRTNWKNRCRCCSRPAPMPWSAK